MRLPCEPRSCGRIVLHSKIRARSSREVKLLPDRALREEIRKSGAELFDAALQSRAAIAIKGAPEQHAEGANVPEDDDR